MLAGQACCARAAVRVAHMRACTSASRQCRMVDRDGCNVHVAPMQRSSAQARRGAQSGMPWKPRGGPGRVQRLVASGWTAAKCMTACRSAHATYSGRAPDATAAMSAGACASVRTMTSVARTRACAIDSATALEQYSGAQALTRHTCSGPQRGAGRSAVEGRRRRVSSQRPGTPRTRDSLGVRHTIAPCGSLCTVPLSTPVCRQYSSSLPARSSQQSHSRLNSHSTHASLLEN